MQVQVYEIQLDGETETIYTKKEDALKHAKFLAGSFFTPHVVKIIEHTLNDGTVRAIIGLDGETIETLVKM